MRIPGFGSINPAGIIEAVKQNASEMLEAGLARMGPAPTAQEYERQVMHTLESWPSSLHALSVPSVSIALSYKERERLVAWWGETSAEHTAATSAAEAWDNALKTFSAMADAKGIRIADDTVIAALVARINVTIADISFKNPFFKLGTRSPKDSPFFDYSHGRVSCGEQIVIAFLSSHRLFADLASSDIWSGRANQVQAIHEQAAAMPIAEFAEMMKTNDLEAAEALRSRPSLEASLDHLPTIWLREFQQIPRYAEFRCFMRNKQYMGATQYHGIMSSPKWGIIYAEAIPEIVAHGWDYDRILRDWFPTFREAASTMNSAVYDVSIDLETGSVLLLETNPADSRTFPGLKDWKNPESFNGELDWVAEPIDHTNHVRLSKDEIAELKRMSESRKSSS